MKRNKNHNLGQQVDLTFEKKKINAVYTTAWYTYSYLFTVYPRNEAILLLTCSS